MQEYWLQFNQWLQSHIMTISIAQMTSLLVVYGDILAMFVRNRLKRKPFFLRISFFIGIHAFLIGFMTVAIAKIISLLYLRIPVNYLFLTLFTGFVLVGVIAERHRHI